MTIDPPEFLRPLDDRELPTMGARALRRITVDYLRNWADGMAYEVDWALFALAGERDPDLVVLGFNADLGADWVAWTHMEDGKRTIRFADLRNRSLVRSIVRVAALQEGR